MSKFILALDQGTTSSRAIIYNEAFKREITQQQEFKQFYPQPSWVEHDPELIWKTQLATAQLALQESEISSKNISAIGITNQRETTIVWNRETGIPVYNAIVWQDRRTADYCKKLILAGHEEMISEKTGLVLDAYFSATKIHWVLENVEGARALATAGKLAFGTVDSWLVWKLTNGKTHITDASNASRTMLFNIATLEWDTALLDLFQIPKSMLPTVVDSCGELAVTDSELFGVPIPITGMAGDQQAALFGQLCTDSGMAKSTYGTGCFLMLNTGNQILKSSHKMLSTIGWKMGGEVTYALEGSVFIGGAVIQWLRDEMEFFVEAADCETLAEAADDNGGVYFVPALTGLGAPHWDPNARGAIFGITRGTSKANLTRAALESICFQVNDVLQAMSGDLDSEITELRVDGGAAANDLLLQFQADISKTKVLKPTQLETTALGVAFLASIGTGIQTIDSLKNKWSLEKTFLPEMEEKRVKLLRSRWNEAVKRSLGWN
tara:strand:- start:4546 stop:6030 length:1485 start_codon:yes stop_codon:yes gene_type:complete